MRNFLHKTSRTKLVVIGGFVLLFGVLLLVLFCNLLISFSSKHITTIEEMEYTEAGIVLGAGVNNQGEPYDELKARLDVAAKAVQEGKVKLLILSGDNRFVNYNEPEAMKQYLLEQGLSEQQLQPDYAGRSTYESCERAKKVFGVDRVVIFSAQSHLARAIFLCQHFDVQAIGVASEVEANNSTRRELLARVKAVYNVYILGEPTVLGPTINLTAS